MPADDRLVVLPTPLERSAIRQPLVADVAERPRRGRDVATPRLDLGHVRLVALEHERGFPTILVALAPTTPGLIDPPDAPTVPEPDRFRHSLAPASSKVPSPLTRSAAGLQQSAVAGSGHIVATKSNRGVRRFRLNSPDSLQLRGGATRAGARHFRGVRGAARRLTRSAAVTAGVRRRSPGGTSHPLVEALPPALRMTYRAPE